MNTLAPSTISSPPSTLSPVGDLFTRTFSFWRQHWFLIAGIILIITLMTALGSLGENSTMLPSLPAISQFIPQAATQFFTGPLSVIYSYFLYQGLKTTAPVVSETDARRIKNAIVIFLIVGITGIVGLLIGGGVSLMRSLYALGTFQNAPILSLPSLAALRFFW